MAGRPEFCSASATDRAGSIEAVRLGEQRRDRVDGYLRAQIPTWSLFPLVQNLGALRGLDTIASAGLAAAIGDPSRFASAPDFMASCAHCCPGTGARTTPPRRPPRSKLRRHRVNGAVRCRARRAAARFSRRTVILDTESTIQGDQSTLTGKLSAANPPASTAINYLTQLRRNAGVH
jgi:hypothetical protein